MRCTYVYGMGGPSSTSPPRANSKEKEKGGEIGILSGDPSGSPNSPGNAGAVKEKRNAVDGDELRSGMETSHETSQSSYKE